MVTKGIITKISTKGNRCDVRLPLFETASSTSHVVIKALVNITPGIYNNLQVNDVVFVSFEENALEKPIIIGKLFKGADVEANIPGGAGVLDTLKVRTSAEVPAETTNFVYSKNAYDETRYHIYQKFNTPKNIADCIIWLKKYTEGKLKKLFNNFVCFKAWTTWQLRPENVEIDDGDLDDPNSVISSKDNYKKYQTENTACGVCSEHNCVWCTDSSSCTTASSHKRVYYKLETDLPDFLDDT